MGWTKTEQLQEIANDYLRETGFKPFSKQDVGAWALRTGRWQPQTSDLIDQCAEEIAKAMREEYITDSHGRSVRAKHAARIEREGKQVTLWADFRTATRAHMGIAFSQRRQQIVGECRQLKIDVDSFNESRSPSEPVQIRFDFTVDLAEMEAALV